MTEEMIAGLLALGAPLLVGGFLFLRKNAGIFLMYAAMILLGLGYLTTTGAVNDIGTSVLGMVHGSAPAPAVVPAAAPAAAEKPAAAPAPAAPAPAPEPKAEAPAEPDQGATPPPPAPAPDAPAPAAPAPAP
jgi:hypothetical protein